MSTSSVVEIDSKQVTKYFLDFLPEFLQVLEEALKSFSEQNGSVLQPLRSSINVAKHNGLLLSMPAYSSKDEALSVKVVTVYPENVKRSLPVVQSTISLFSSVTGALKAIIDGNSLTALRTAAVSAIATKYLAAKNSHVLALIGAGTQARSHFEILSKLYSFSEVKIWNIREDSAKKLVKEITDRGINATFCANVDVAVDNADIIVTATLAENPVLFSSWVKPGCHINAVGACVADWQEIDAELMNSAVVYVDSREAAQVEAGDIILSKATIHAEIGEIISGEKEIFPEKTTIFKSLGMAIEDTVTANLVYKYAQNS